MSQLRHLSHFVDLHGIGGIERDFMAFARTSHENRLLANDLALKGELHAWFEPAIQEYIRHTHRVRYLGPLRLRGAAAWLRDLLLRRYIRRSNPDCAVFWSQMGHPEYVNAYHTSRVPVVYYEHGAAWINKLRARNRRFLQRVDGVVCNSHAARRMLELRWNFAGPVHVSPNALRPEVCPPHPVAKILDRTRPVRIGTSGRLVPVKGHVLSVLTVKALRDRGYDCELHIAGDGPERDRLQAIVKNLGLVKHVNLHGMLKEPTAFYRAIDILLTPSVSESFGLASAEGAAWGCPVVASRTDGLPETLDEGVTGFTVPATLALSEYALAGGRLQGLPSLTYDPDGDCLRSAAVPDPSILASAIEPLLIDDMLYANVSRRASIAALERFDYQRHTVDLISGIAALIRRSGSRND